MTQMTRRSFAVAGCSGIAIANLPPERIAVLRQLAAGPIIVELPGEEPRTLVPGAPRAILDSVVSEFPSVGPLSIRQLVTDRSGVIERTIEVASVLDATFNIEIPYEMPRAESFYSWLRKEAARTAVVHEGFEKRKPGESAQLFPFAGAVEDGWLTGAIADTPGFWENRSQQIVDPSLRRIALRTGDGSGMRTVVGAAGHDPKVYHAEYDGWQRIRCRELRQYSTWLFSAPVRDLYEVQLAAHRALARAKGWHDSDLMAILRNTSYLLVRRNLVRPESRYIVISGVTYGWHQWVDDMGMTVLALRDPELLAEGCRGAYLSRCLYEDNAQWYLILSALVARAGFHPNRAQCRRALEFLRDRERNGAYIPPDGANGPETRLGWKSYMDIFFYEEGDAPTSNQGFHCGALVAARELGFAVTDPDVQRASNAYAKMFNQRDGYFPTSMMRQEVFGGDALYGEAVTFAAFGRKSLPDELVLRHCRHAMKIQSPYGIRVMSKANGDLLEANQYGPNNQFALPPERAGAYVQGGSWFFCDAGTWLSGLAHGLDPSIVDSLLIRRIKAELARVPAFNESIHTRTGEPHGNILYSANSLYAWLRPAIRQRLGQGGPDPVDVAIDEHLRTRNG